MSNGYWPKVCQQTVHPIQCWFANIEEEGSWEPGVSRCSGIDSRSIPRRNAHSPTHPTLPHTPHTKVVERLGLYFQSDNERCRDRHLRLSVRHVDGILRRALPLHGKRNEFVARWGSGPMAMTFNEGGNITWAPHMEV